jgi:hypothetical protein
MGNYYIYVLKCPISNKIRYIGKGTKNRAWRFTKRYGHCQSWIKWLKQENLKPLVCIVKSNITEERAFHLEKLLIRFCRLFNFDLTNLTDGGDGASGFKRSEKTLELLKPTQFKKGSIPWNKGKAANNELKERIKLGVKLGKKPKFSKESREKQKSGLNEYCRSKKCRIKATHKITKEELIFESMMDAERAGFRQSEISKCCKDTKYTHKKYYWRKI